MYPGTGKQHPFARTVTSGRPQAEPLLLPPSGFRARQGRLLCGSAGGKQQVLMQMECDSQPRRVVWIVTISMSRTCGMPLIVSIDGRTWEAYG